jgi:ubiquinone/menaquinone biosynthesis C-methylase UbiE
VIQAALFTWVQGADFYRDVHQAAVELLPHGDGQTWLDVGSGPGLVARLAAQRGYQTIGLDYDAQMIQAAKSLAKRQGLSIEFKVGDVFNLPVESADVVSAASLLAVLDDKAGGLRSLWGSVRPGGALLIIEPTEQMTHENANQVIKNGLGGKRIKGLRMWAAARQGNTIKPGLYDKLGAPLDFTPLLSGLVGAWVIRKSK